MKHKLPKEIKPRIKSITITVDLEKLCRTNELVLHKEAKIIEVKSKKEN